jgi:asparaginyl-tRNA synthetase
MSYTDAIKELKNTKETFEFPVEWGSDLQSEHERYLTEKVIKGPMIISDFPKDIKAFYMRLNPDGQTVAAMDVLVPKIGEIIGGSQREDRIEVLEERMKQFGIPLENLQWYLDLRRFGSAPHAGFGLGFERLVQYITGMVNIRDVIPCPRAPRTIVF